MKNNKSKGAIFTGLIAALAASSCCIPPIIAAIAGIGGFSASLSWIEPIRPYLIIVAFIAISYTWYSHFKQKKLDDCGCTSTKSSFFQSKSFLISMTLFAFISITFPYYSHIFYSNNKNIELVYDEKNYCKIEINIKGMTCIACENHINTSVSELKGIINVNTSYKKKNTVVEYDKSLTSLSDIKAAINATGYTVTK